jgi:hypothetical protein
MEVLQKNELGRQPGSYPETGLWEMPNGEIQRICPVCVAVGSRSIDCEQRPCEARDACRSDYHAEVRIALPREAFTNILHECSDLGKTVDNLLTHRGTGDIFALILMVIGLNTGL